jgi:radical SAM protein with 4Fe4S-binding SPASM domain
MGTKHMNIRNKLFSTKIGSVQLDPFGFCNAKCWFCPVRYKPQPEVGLQVMPVELIEKILVDLVNEKNKFNGIVDSRLDLILTAHYNEILLYKHFEEMLKLFRKYKFKTFVLSNGISLNKENIDMIKSYQDVVTQVGLNIPAFERDLWADRSGFSPDQFDRLLNNLRYAEEQLLNTGYNIQIHVNGIDSNIPSEMMKFSPEFNKLKMDLNPISGEHEKQLAKARELFPKWNVTKNGLFDRAGHVDIISYQDYLNKISNNKKVVSCNSWRGDRSTQWLHINSAGQTFLCCNDYNFDYVFGNLSEQTLNQIWGSDRHIHILEKAYNEICRKCFYATFE